MDVTMNDRAVTAAPNADPIIGLEVGGRLFYTHISTLTRGPAKGSYFEKRFGPDSSFSSEYDYIDKHDRKVFFIDRDSDLFAYVLQYLRSGALPPLLGDFYENPKLWRALRLEADFYQLEGLTAILHVVFSCSPEVHHGDKGVLYWLGTNKGKQEYRNPFDIGQVHVGGWMDENPPQNRFEEHAIAGKHQNRAAWVQHHPKAKVNEISDTILQISSFHGQGGTYCVSAAASRRRPIIVYLCSIALCPTHYSLRYDTCYGMQGNWNFEASFDGKNWDILHAARDDEHLRGPNREEKRPLYQLLAKNADNSRDELATSYLEARHRHSWKVQAQAFYRYFRIVGADDQEDSDRCLHGTGLELFGHVHES